MSGYFASDTTSCLSIRPYRPDDLPQALRLVRADQLPGEAPAPGLPSTPLAGRADTVTLTGANHIVHGVMCLSVRDASNIGLIHWLHTGEDFDAASTLLTFARSHLGQRTLQAFTSPASLADVPGLPMQHRHVTARALAVNGFTPAGAQVFLLRSLSSVPEMPEEPVADVMLLSNPPGWRLTISVNGAATATAVVRQPDPRSGTALLWHLDVYPAYRRMGFGQQLLAQCMYVAAASGARQIAAYSDQDDGLIQRFLRSHGFNAIDRLAVYRRRSN
ncbi:GNAT family N-acetyltransferase [Streptomyces sp. NPDC056534]|uniref:GNAT family N-acetyltransferase n=1 Tax=Streptomyces sp. NPDC056534 TaxID=3345857 RepID=UPI0036C52A55